MESILANAALAPLGEQKIEWVRGHMPVLSGIADTFEKDQPFKGLKAVICIHLEAKTAYLAQVLRRGGAEVYATGSNPLSTQDDVCAALAASGVTVLATHGCDAETFHRYECEALSVCPDLMIDDGGDLVQIMRGDSERSLGWLKMMREQGADPAPAWRICLRELDGRGDLFLQHLRREKLTALFAQNDYVACKVMSLLLQHGLRVPEDVAIIGCDGYAFTDFMPGGLTTMVQPVSVLALRTVDLMLDRISRHDLQAAPARIRIAPVLRRAGSCGCPPLRTERLFRINTPSLLEKDHLLNFNDDILEQ